MDQHKRDSMGQHKRDTMGISVNINTHGFRTVYIDNKEWCHINWHDYFTKFVPALKELQARRKRVATGEADVTLN